MILTQCAACAKPLAHDAPRCVRCWTRYCDASCQLKHWSNGHKKQCKKIARGGGAEQFYADAKYKEAAEAAAVACRPNIPADATCIICGQGQSEEALLCSTTNDVSRCLCHAHASCVLREKQIGVTDTGTREGMLSWWTCSRCGKCYDNMGGVVFGWGAWATYLHAYATIDSRPSVALMITGLGLSNLGRHEEALPLFEAIVERDRRLLSESSRSYDDHERLRNCYMNLERWEDALRISREMFAGFKAAHGPRHEAALKEGVCIIALLGEVGNFDEMKAFADEQWLLARRALGKEHDLVRDLAGVRDLAYRGLSVFRHADVKF